MEWNLWNSGIFIKITLVAAATLLCAQTNLKIIRPLYWLRQINFLGGCYATVSGYAHLLEV